MRHSLTVLLSLDQDTNGHYFFVVRAADTDRPVRVSVSSDIFAFPAVALDTLSLRTISPLAVFQIRIGLALTGAMSHYRDVVLQSRILTGLAEKFFSGVPGSRLLPDIEALPDLRT